MRSILFALVLLAAANETASAATMTVTVVNHRPSGARVMLPYGWPCTHGNEQSVNVQTTATYSCDTAGAQRGPNDNVELFEIGSNQGVSLCALMWYDHPWKYVSWGPVLPPGVSASQQTNSGQSNDRTIAGCAVTQTGASDFQVDVTAARGWMGDQY